MKEYITIKNFGPLKDIDNIRIFPFTILIGESASGKSTLMKVLVMMRYLYKMANIRSYLRHSKITRTPFRMRLYDMMTRQGMNKIFDKKNTLIIYRIKTEDEIDYEIRIENGKLSLPIIKKEHLVFSKNSYISENRNIIPTWAQNAYKGRGATLGFYFHETNSDFVAASDGDKELNLNYVGMKLEITHPKGKPTKYQIIPDDNRHGPIDLTETSSGIQTSAPLALIVNYFSKDFSFKDAFNRSVMTYLYEMENLQNFKAVSEPTELPKIINIHIEEPELSLFPDAQCRMIDDLIYTATHAKEDRKLNMMIATHSPYILNYLNIVLNQTKEGRAKLSNENTVAYRLYEGKLQNLLMQNAKGNWIVDSYDLSEIMGNIYNEFLELDI